MWFCWCLLRNICQTVSSQCKTPVYWTAGAKIIRLVCFITTWGFTHTIQSTASMRDRSFVGRPMASRMMAMVMMPPAGMPAAPTLEAVAVTLETATACQTQPPIVILLSVTELTGWWRSVRRLALCCWAERWRRQQCTGRWPLRPC